MPRPRQHTRFEVQLVRETDNLKTAILNLRHELANKERYAGRLEYLLRTRSEKIADLNGKVEQLRRLNTQLDAENERLVEMMRFTPQLDVAMLAPK